MKKNLVLTGMMGVGKSTVGKGMAKKLSYDFIDIDKLIETNEKDNSELTLYPNPNNGIFNFKLENLKKGKYNYIIVDVAGKIIVNKEIDVNSNQEIVEVNSVNFDKGVYFLCLKSSFNFNKNIKFVVSN